ncbi:MAG: TRAP transporter small permease subunit [Pseudomonadota bacterium]
MSWFFEHLISMYAGLIAAIANPAAWLNWSDKEALTRFIYFGASVEFFLFVAHVFIITLIVGLLYRPFLWRVVRGVEYTNNTIGRLFAWAGFLMVVQQVLIVALQRVFRVSEISLGPFSPLGYSLLNGPEFARDLSWWSEELKLFNAMIVALCAAYTFVQGGHVRVDLFYAGAKYRTKKIVDMLGSVFFILPFMTFVWLFGWFFMWRHLVTPKINATDKFEILLRKSRILKWNVETIGFSPNGFDAYFLFKILLVAFAGLMFAQGIAFFYRSLLEMLEGPDAENKYLDRDDMGAESAQAQAAEVSESNTPALGSTS